MGRQTLTPDLLCQAYSLGYFPMPDPHTGEIVFLRPDPRAVLPLGGFHASRSLRRSLRRGNFSLSTDQAFGEVMQGCANRDETWIGPEFFEGYSALFDQGMAHSVEVWQDARLVAGLYGVTLGGAFFAESKFNRERDASKIALWGLVQTLRDAGFVLLEVQFLTDHLKALGVEEVPDATYQELLGVALGVETAFPVLEKREIEVDRWIVQRMD